MEHNSRGLAEETTSNTYVSRASALKLCMLIHWFFLLPVKLMHLDLLLRTQHWSESHTLTQEQSNVCAWVRSEVQLWTIFSSCPCLFEMREPNLHSHQHTAQPQIVTQRQRFWLSPSLLSQCCLIADSLSVFWTFSKHFYGTDHSLLLSVSRLLTSYLSTQGPFPSYYGCLESLLEIQALMHPTTCTNLPGPLHPGTTITSRQMAPETVIWTKLH